MRHIPDLPTGYYLEMDPDVLTLHRSDTSIIYRFSAVGVELDEIRKAAEQDFYSGAIDSHEPQIPDAVTDQPCLQVRFLGHFEIRCSDETVDLGRNGKPLTIFKYLLAHRDRWVSRDHLMGWLWPESTPMKARRSLNVAICSLRKRLRDYSVSLQDYLLFEKGYYRLCPAIRVMTDVEELDLRYEQGRRMEKANHAKWVAEYERAIELYQGEYLLEHLYEDWTIVERERLSIAYMDMLERLAVYYKQTEQPRESIKLCYQILEKDRSHENAHLLLAEAYVRLGSYSRASHQYRLYKGVLKRTYGTEPSVEMEKRFEEVLDRRVARPLD